MTHQTALSDNELRFLTAPTRPGGHRRARRNPHVVPSGWTFNTELDTLDVTGREVHGAENFRDVIHTGKPRS